MSVITSARQVLPSTVVRFAVIGVVNTTIDIVLFWVLHAPLGIVVANFVSTSAGMTFSFLANGRYTFGSTRVTLRQAALFLATNGFTMWLLQPLLIHAAYDVATVPLMAAKVVALAGSVVVNFLLYRHVVWSQRAGSAAGPEGRGSGVGADRLSERTAEPARP
jgi:putative flippase GtrA